MTGSFVAMVLAGGRGKRLGGVDKGALTLQGRTLLHRALTAVAGATQVVVVGDRPPGGPDDVVYLRERPAFAGPAAALLTGADALDPDQGQIAVLAVDMPMVTTATIDRLRRAATGRDGAVLVDASGNRQLALVLSRSRLAAITPDPADWDGLAIWRLLRDLDLAPVDADTSEAQDVDTPADLAALRDAVPPA